METFHIPVDILDTEQFLYSGSGRCPHFQTSKECMFTCDPNNQGNANGDTKKRRFVC